MVFGGLVSAGLLLAGSVLGGFCLGALASFIGGLTTLLVLVWGLIAGLRLGLPRAFLFAAGSALILRRAATLLARVRSLGLLILATRAGVGVFLGRF